MWAKSAAVEKNVPPMGVLRRAPASLGTPAQNLGLQSAFTGPWWALGTSCWLRVVWGGGMFMSRACCFKNAPGHMGALTDARFCEF